tara:strand:+ start:5474 stop:5638 length:165 start_codon:yes stop_codon:yes gene_type:complete
MVKTGNNIILNLSKYVYSKMNEQKNITLVVKIKLKKIDKKIRINKIRVLKFLRL